MSNPAHVFRFGIGAKIEFALLILVASWLVNDLRLVTPGALLGFGLALLAVSLCGLAIARGSMPSLPVVRRRVAVPVAALDLRRPVRAGALLAA